VKIDHKPKPKPKLQPAPVLSEAEKRAKAQEEYRWSREHKITPKFLTSVVAMVRSKALRYYFA